MRSANVRGNKKRHSVRRTRGRKINQRQALNAVHVNVSQETIVVTGDKMRLVLNDVLISAKRQQAWHAPAGLLLSEVATLVASTFHSAMGLTGDQWNVLFVVGMIVTMLWLPLAITRGRRQPSVDEILGLLKNRSQSTSAEHLDARNTRWRAFLISMNISLSQELEQLVRDHVKSGRYRSASEVVRDALRLLQERDRRRDVREAVAEAKRQSYDIGIVRKMFAEDGLRPPIVGKDRRKRAKS